LRPQFAVRRRVGKIDFNRIFKSRSVCPDSPQLPSSFAIAIQVKRIVNPRSKNNEVSRNGESLHKFSFIKIENIKAGCWKVRDPKKQSIVVRETEIVHAQRNGARYPRFLLQRRHSESFDSNRSSLGKHMLLVGRQSDARSRLDELGHLVGFEVNCIKSAAAYVLRCKSCAHK